MFQISMNIRLSLRFTYPKYAMKGAVTPATISKFRPSNVIILGIYFSRNNHHNMISTNNLTTCSLVKISGDSVSTNFLPDGIKNKIMMNKNAGATDRANLGGVPPVTM